MAQRHVQPGYRAAVLFVPKGEPRGKREISSLSLKVLLTHLGGAVHLHTPRLQLEVPAGVIVVVVSVEYVRQRPAPLVELPFVSRRARRVDRGRVSRLRIVYQVPEIKQIYYY